MKQLILSSRPYLLPWTSLPHLTASITECFSDGSNMHLVLLVKFSTESNLNWLYRLISPNTVLTPAMLSLSALELHKCHLSVLFCLLCILLHSQAWSNHLMSIIIINKLTICSLPSLIWSCQVSPRLSRVKPSFMNGCSVTACHSILKKTTLLSFPPGREALTLLINCLYLALSLRWSSTYCNINIWRFPKFGMKLSDY